MRMGYDDNERSVRLVWQPMRDCEPERERQQGVRHVESILGQNPVDRTTAGSRYQKHIVSKIMVAFNCQMPQSFRSFNNMEFGGREDEG